jgi:hypothetical protein
MDKYIYIKYKKVTLLLASASDIYIYIYETLVYMKSNSNTLITNANVHSYNTRRKEDLHIAACNTSLCKNTFNNLGLRLLNHLPQYIKDTSIT